MISLIRLWKGTIEMKDTNTSKHAVDLVTEGEKSVSPEYDHSNGRLQMDWSEFWHMFISWFASGSVIFGVLVILTMSDKSDNLWRDLIFRTDTISLTFSLVLSAGLEQIWNSKKQWKYKVTQIVEIVLAILGLILYLAYSLWEIYDKKNPYYQNRFCFNLIYIILSLSAVVIGFLSRALVDKEGS